MRVTCREATQRPRRRRCSNRIARFVASMDRLNPSCGPSPPRSPQSEPAGRARRPAQRAPRRRRGPPRRPQPARRQPRARPPPRSAGRPAPAAIGATDAAHPARHRRRARGPAPAQQRPDPVRRARRLRPGRVDAHLHNRRRRLCRAAPAGPAAHRAPRRGAAGPLRAPPGGRRRIPRAKNGNVGLGVTSLSGEAPGLRRRRLWTDPYVVALRRAHPLLQSAHGKRTRLTPAQHAALPRVRVSPEGQGTSQLDDALERSGLRRTIVYRTPSFASALAVVAASDLVATVPARALTAFGEARDLVALPVTFIAPLAIDLCFAMNVTPTALDSLAGHVCGPPPRCPMSQPDPRRAAPQPRRPGGRATIVHTASASTSSPKPVSMYFPPAPSPAASAPPAPTCASASPASDRPDHKNTPPATPRPPPPGSRRSDT